MFHTKRLLRALGLTARRRRQAISIAAAAVAATVLLLTGSLLAWNFYLEWRLGRIELTTVDAPVVVQVLAESSDTLIGEPVDLVTRAVVALPAGDYRLQVSGKGRLSRTYRFAVNRGETQTHEISIDEGRLLGGERNKGFGGDERPRDVPIPYAPLTMALELTPGKSALIEWSGNSVIRRDGATGTIFWDTLHPAHPFERNHDPVPWMRSLSDHEKKVRLVDRAPDLNGDGTGDLLWFSPSMSAFLAQSGKDGSMLWNYTPELDGPGGPRADGPESNGEVIGAPALADVDRDGAPDLIAAVNFSESDRETARRAADGSSGAVAINKVPLHRRLVMAISGRSGGWLWSYPLDKAFVDVPKESYSRSAALVEGRRSALVEVINGAQWLGLDPATGRPKAGPFQLGFIPRHPVLHADLDGDGEPEILALETGPLVRENTLHAFSKETGRELWAEPVATTFDWFRIGAVYPDFPMTADLDGDGRAEIVVADAGPMPPLSGYRGVELLEGLTGKPRWRRPMRPDTNASDLIEAIVAPDLDGDGSRDLVTVSLIGGKNPPRIALAAAEEPAHAYVDAISGKDGRPLWWWRVELPLRKFTRFWPLHWWGRGHDGWPLLAVPLGGTHPDGVEANLGRSSVNPPNVHLLEASTGIERHTVSGLNKAGYGDFDGDGLADLWGEVDGELRAFRGEAPEAWRALGRFEPAHSSYPAVDLIRSPSVDLDGDGVADTLANINWGPGDWPRWPTFSRIALARSGRDGRVIWKTELDPAASWFGPGRTDWYFFTAFPMPGGDFNGDGTPDVIVQQPVSPQWRAVGFKHAATLPIQVLSGRTGSLLWRAGPLPLGFDAKGYSQIHSINACTVEANSAPDLFVRHDSQFVQPGPTPPATKTPAARSAGRPSLARISGRDGRILWNVPLADGEPLLINQHVPPDQFADLDGDGGLDALIMLPPTPDAGSPDYTMAAVSLRDGERLWSRPLRCQLLSNGDVRIGDLDGDTLPDVVFMEILPGSDKGALHVRVFNGRDGKVRWTWTSAADLQNERPRIILAQLDGNGTWNVCVSFKVSPGVGRIVVLDSGGKERARHDMTGEYFNALAAADLNGDGRDDLLVWNGDRLAAWGPDLKEAWSWPDRSASIDQVLPGSRGRPGAVIISPALALDGATGQPRWTGQAPLSHSPVQSELELLDRGDSARLPLFLSVSIGATVCRVALPTTPQGQIAPPRGTHVKPGRVPDDPRWERPLPWLESLKGFVGPWGFLAAAGLGFVNVALPLFIFRLFAGRRRFSIRALMALPIAAALPLMCFLLLEPLLPVGSTPLLASENRVFIVGALAGVPIVFYVFWMGASVARLRWKSALALAGLTVLASLSVAAVWIWFDMKSMPAIEHYGSAGWQLILLPGAYAAAMLSIAALVVLKIHGGMKRRRPPG